jgi:diadenosine tetraphosphate (Ap4A) HIT family hydrolase
MRHYRKTLRKYAKLNSGDKKLHVCTFCNEYIHKGNVLAENDTMFIIPNRVSYDMFEGQRVVDHLMVIPKRHVEMIDNFTKAEMLDQMKIIADYEKKGYDIYARGVGNVARSIKHQHTHLIKGDNKNKWPRFILFIRKPYILISK